MALLPGFKVVKRTVDLGIPYTINSPNLIVTLPDGTQTTIVPNLISPGLLTVSNPHDFTTLYIPTLAGPHTAILQFIYSGQTINAAMEFWVPWTGVYKNIREMLGVTENNVPDSIIDMQFKSTYLWFLNFSGTSLPLYHLFTDSYKINFDLAMSYIVASKLRPRIGGKRSSGEVSLFKKGTTTVQFTNTQPRSNLSIEQTWWLEGLALLDAFIPEISSTLDIDRYGDEVMNRGDLAIGNYKPTGNWAVYPGGGNSDNTFNGIGINLFNTDGISGEM